MEALLNLASCKLNPDAKKQKELVERALAIIEKHDNIDPTQLVRTLDYLAIANERLGDYKKAKEITERSVKFVEKNPGIENSLASIIKARLANLHIELSYYKNELL